MNKLIKLACEKDKSLLQLENSNDFFYFCLKVYSPKTLLDAYKLLIAAINLAKEEKRVESNNPYSVYKATLTAMVTSKNKGEGEFKRTRETYTQDELEIIFAAFSSNKYCAKKSAYQHSYYLPYVKFLAYTGCRPEEAIALTTSDIVVKNNKPYISINKAFTHGELKGTKTGESRMIPINEQLMEVLQSCHVYNPSGLLFPSIKAKTYMNQGNFQTGIMAKITAKLYAEGKISKILPCYNLRHTRITSLLQSGINPSTVAQLMGTSTEMIYKHYCGNLIDGIDLPTM